MKKLLFSAAIYLLLLPAMTAFAGQKIVTGINPILTGGQRQVTVREVPAGAGGEFQACDENAYDYNSFKLGVLRRMRLKDTDFTICFTGGYQPSRGIFEMLDEIEADQDVPWLINSYYQVTGYPGTTQFRYVFDYWHTQSQEAQLESAVRDQVRQLVTSGMDMPSREKAIHDWIVHHVTYDETYVKHSDYNAFFDQSAVCQGYALLTDRMLAMAGVEDKIVNGKANGGDHAWNMVKLCDTWFHLDTTFDDPIGMGTGYIRWDYFNITDGEIGANHSWTYADYPACNDTYVDGFCHGEVVNGCSIFQPQKCLTELACLNASGTWNGSCSIAGSGGGGGGSGGGTTANGFPSTSQTPVTFPASVYPANTPVTVPTGMVALTPRLSGVNCNEVVSAIAYIYLPLANFGLSVPAKFTCDGGGVVTISIGTGSIDFSGYPGTYYIYFGYVDFGGVIHYNAYELIAR